MDKLTEFQSKIDEINSQILNLIVKRNQIVKKIGQYKKEKNLPVYNFKREQEIYDKFVGSAEKKGLNRSFVKRLFSLILWHSKKDQGEDEDE